MQPAHSIKGSNRATVDRTRTELDALFSPRGIAVIGASEKVGSVGRAVFENLSSFGEPVFAVNPNHKAILGKRSYRSVAEIEKVVDLAVIATPAPAAPEVISDCACKHVSAAIILSAGFKEIGAAGRELEMKVVKEAARGGIRLLGPNCLGAMIPHNNLNASFAKRIAKPGNIALLSQSGALCTGILDWSFRENVGFSGFVSVGSAADIGWGDLIDYFAEDPHTKSIFCYIESIGNARSFMSAVREAALLKPVVILKAGRTTAAAAAAASHTGSLTGSDAVIDAAFRRCGALRVESLDEFFNLAELLSKQPLPCGGRLAIITNAGGPGVLAADRLVQSGGILAKLSPATLSRLDDLLPSFWSHANPVDVLGDADTARFIKALECVTTDPGNDAVLAVISPQAMTDVKSISYGLRDSAAHSAKPVLGSLIGGASVAAGRAILNCGRIPTFDSPDAASRTFALASRHAAEIHQLCEVTEENGRPWAGLKAARAIADTAIKAARETGRTALNAAEACNVLRAYGLPVIDATIASTEGEAICLAEKVGFPVAVKLQSPKILHKADVGGVVLNVAHPDEVRRAWRKIRDNVAAAGSEAFAGVTIQPMAQTSSVELIFGSTIDSQFGPTILFGAGGKWVEVMHDTVIGLPPLNRTLARRLIEHTRVSGALKGARGEKPADFRALELALVNFAELVVREPSLAEIDINPVLIVDGKPIAVDARMILHDKDVEIDRLPSPAIRPYPIENVFPQQLKNGTTVLLRPVRAEDESLMAEFHQNISDRSVYFRYFMPLRLEQRIEHERLCRRCCVDYDRELGLIAEHPSTDGERRIVGVGRLTRIRSTKAAEFALLVADKWQGQGLGEALLERLVAIGKKEKLDQITGVILEENHAMRRLAEKMGFTMQHSSGECVASKTL